MHLLEHLHRNVKTIAMPSAMIVGALLCRPIAALEEWTGQMITPTLIFLMLFVTFCRVKPSQMKPSMLHFWLLLVQVVACVGIFLLLRPLNGILAQGAMVCVLAPVAMAAVVIGGMLGANVATMATYSLLCNMAVALLAPVILTFTGTGACTFAQILARIAPLLVMPFAAAQFCRMVIPKAAKWVGDHTHHRPHDGFHHRPARRFAFDRTVAGLRGACDLSCAVQGGPHAGTPLRRRSGGRPVAGPEKHGPRGVDGPVVPRPDRLDRAHCLHRVAEFRELVSVMEKRQRRVS